MDLNSIFSFHEHALKIRSYRSEILASNLANADTPEYKARDLDFNEVIAQFENQEDVGLNVTNSNHLNDMKGNLNVDLKYTTPIMTKNDGNTVDTHIENAKLSENSIRFAAGLRIIDYKVKSLITAIKGE